MTNSQDMLDHINQALGYDCTKEDKSFELLKEIVAEMLPGWSLVPNVGTEVLFNGYGGIFELFKVTKVTSDGIPVLSWYSSGFCVSGEYTGLKDLGDITPKPKD